MRIKICLLMFICILIICCGIFSPKKNADVVMLEGPIFEDGYIIFTFKGTVKNQGDGKAMFVRIYIYCRNGSGDLLAQENSYVDRVDLNPNDTSAWSVIFSDEDSSIRNIMDLSQTTYNINWDEEK